MSLLRIAVLDCDIPVPTVLADRGFYADIFASLLVEANKGNKRCQTLDLTFQRYDCVGGELPTEEDLIGIDGIIITGSSASAYDPDPWITSLTTFTSYLYTSHPRIKIFGSCFGHQLLCSALFSSPTQQVVHRDPAGWELGVHPIALSPSFLSHFGPVTSNLPSPSELRLQFVHADHVVLPLPLPEGFEVVGSSQHCALQGIWQKGRVLTYQGHAEFDEFVNRETIKVFGTPIWELEILGNALRAVEGVDDAIWAAQVMLRFFVEDGLVAEAEEHISEVDDGGVMARL